MLTILCSHIWHFMCKYLVFLFRPVTSGQLREFQCHQLYHLTIIFK